MRNYKKIKAWEFADRLALEIYRATKSFPKEEVYGLTSQMRRAALSVAANIVEGASRSSKKDYLHFLNISLGSLNELGYFLNFSYRLGYLNSNYEGLKEQYETSIKTLKALIKHIKSN